MFETLSSEKFSNALVKGWWQREWSRRIDHIDLSKCGNGPLVLSHHIPIVTWIVSISIGLSLFWPVAYLQYSDQFTSRLPIDISVNQHLAINHSNDRLVNETNKINHSMGLFTWKIFTLKDHSHKHSTAPSKRGTFIRLFAQIAQHPNRLSAQHSIEISSMSAATGWKLMNGIDESNQLLFKKTNRERRKLEKERESGNEKIEQSKTYVLLPIAPCDVVYLLSSTINVFWLCWS